VGRLSRRDDSLSRADLAPRYRDLGIGALDLLACRRGFSCGRARLGAGRIELLPGNRRRIYLLECLVTGEILRRLGGVGQWRARLGGGLIAVRFGGGHLRTRLFELGLRLCHIGACLGNSRLGPGG